MWMNMSISGKKSQQDLRGDSFRKKEVEEQLQRNLTNPQTPRAAWVSESRLKQWQILVGCAAPLLGPAHVRPPESGAHRTHFLSLWYPVTHGHKSLRKLN